MLFGNNLVPAAYEKIVVDSIPQTGNIAIPAPVQFSDRFTPVRKRTGGKGVRSVPCSRGDLIGERLKSRYLRG